MLTDEARALKNQYLKEWRKNNKERVSEYNKRYREANPNIYKKAKERYWNKKAQEMASNQREGGTDGREKEI